MRILCWWIYATYFRPILKWFLRRTTGLCELQRICYATTMGAERTKAVEYSLTATRSAQIKRLTRHLDRIARKRHFVGHQDIVMGAVTTILYVKHINPQIHHQFVANCADCVEEIWSYRQLLAEIEEKRATHYSSADESHEMRLYELWSRLRPDEALDARVTKQWQTLGFQSDDPKTDFRGMGLLGLDNLLHFASEYSVPCRRALLHSQHPQYGYPFAIVGINLTSMAVQIFRDGDAKTYFYGKVKDHSEATMRVFHQFYSYLFYEFDKYWLEARPKDVMEFACIKNSFEKGIRNSLRDTNNVFRINVFVDTV